MLASTFICVYIYVAAVFGVCVCVYLCVGVCVSMSMRDT